MIAQCLVEYHSSDSSICFFDVQLNKVPSVVEHAPDEVSKHHILFCRSLSTIVCG